MVKKISDEILCHSVPTEPAVQPQDTYGYSQNLNFNNAQVFKLAHTEL